MNTSTLVMLSAAMEAATGVVLIAAPGFVARILLGASLPDSGIAVARVAGFALLALGLACWPNGGSATQPAIRALFTYNLLVGMYFGYLRVGEDFVGYLLWPACGLHALLALLLARPAYDGVLAATADRAK